MSVFNSLDIYEYCTYIKDTNTSFFTMIDIRMQYHQSDKEMDINLQCTFYEKITTTDYYYYYTGITDIRLLFKQIK